MSRFVLTTFHSLASSILQQHGSHISLAPNFSILTDDVDRISLLENVMTSLNLQLNQSSTRLISLLSRLYESCHSAANIADLVPDNDLAGAMEKIYKRYARYAISKGTLDFPLLVFLARQLLERFPHLAKHMRRTYRCIGIDEFQDTNEAQFLLLKAIIGGDPSGLFVVADDDQTIYQWNGASPRRIDDLRLLYGMKVIQLPESHRCPPSLIAAANALIAHNVGRLSRLALVTTRPASQDQKLRVTELANFEDELDYLTQRLISGLPGTTAVLGRSRRILEPALEFARHSGIEAFSPIKKTSFESTPLQFLLAILRLANKPNDENAGKTLVRTFQAMSGTEQDYLTLESLAQVEGSDLLSVWLALARRTSAEPLFLRMLDVVDRELIQRKIYKNVAPSVFDWIDAGTGGLEKQNQIGSDFVDYCDERVIWANMQRVISGLPGQEVSLSEFLREVDLTPKMPEAPPNCVYFLTVHTAKGLEFDNVFIIGAAEKQFPTFQAVQQGSLSRAMEEERRSFFVAVTRTATVLEISYARSYFGWNAEASRFIAEMNLETGS
jgi:DNA helicase-2/ATP-dependent DNA helicase PcrA